MAVPGQDERDWEFAEAFELPIVRTVEPPEGFDGEAYNFDLRKNLLEYDDVANDQRKVIYQQRTELMAADEIEESVAAIRDEVIADAVALHIPPGSLEEQWDSDGLSKALEADFGLDVDVARLVTEDKSINDEGIADYCIEQARKAYKEREQKIGSELMRNVEKQVMLRQLDHHWKEHLAAMDHLRQGIGLRSYAQKNPKQEYKREAFDMFGAMLEQVKHDTISILTRIRIQGEDDLAEMQRQREERLRREADEARIAEEYAAYIARIGVTNARIEENAFDRALTLLDQCPPGQADPHLLRTAHD